MLRLKYKNDVAMGEVLSRPLLGLISQAKWPVESVVPVPASVARKRQRGYNQAALLALPVALGLDRPYQPRALVKVRETRSQVGLKISERFENVAEAFEARRELVRGKNILVVDDVTTSGATIEACAAALLQADASQVYGLTLARSAFSPG